MQIAGIQKLTLVDFPDHVAATVFTRGCSFRCGFCHNPELVLPDHFSPLLDEKQIFDFLETRYGKLTGICITGGEPCMQPDVDKFISHMKALGFDVKLDTNGSFPDKLEQIIKDGDVDYIAMDIKTTLEKYQSVAIPNSKFLISNQIPKLKTQKPGVIPDCKLEIRDPDTAYSGSTDKALCHPVLVSGSLEKKIQKSIRLIMSSGIPYEFRTTVCHPLHEVADFQAIGEMIKGAEKYYIQNFVKSKHINEAIDYKPFEDDEIEEAKNIMSKYIKYVDIR